MVLSDIPSTSCAFIPVYCYYDEVKNSEHKTPILLMDQNTLLLSAILVSIDPSIFSYDELKDQFIDAYYFRSHDSTRNRSLDEYDIYPQLATSLHTDEEEISVYICELYENSERYFKRPDKSKITSSICYRDSFDELVHSGTVDPLTEKILISLCEEGFISKDDKNELSNIELF